MQLSLQRRFITRYSSRIIRQEFLASFEIPNHFGAQNIGSMNSTELGAMLQFRSKISIQKLRFRGFDSKVPIQNLQFSLDSEILIQKFRLKSFDWKFSIPKVSIQEFDSTLIQLPKLKLKVSSDT